MNRTILMLLVFLFALILTIIPLTSAVFLLRPPWVLLSILYMQFYIPNEFKIYMLFILGCTMDSLLYTVIGEHLFALAVVIWLTTSKARSFCMAPIGHQMLRIGLYGIVYQGCLALIDSLCGDHVKFISIIGPSIIGVLLWPWLRLIGDNCFLKKNSNIAPEIFRSRH